MRHLIAGDHGRMSINMDTMATTRCLRHYMGCMLVLDIRMNVETYDYDHYEEWSGHGQ